MLLPVRQKTYVKFSMSEILQVLYGIEILGKSQPISQLQLFCSWEGRTTNISAILFIFAGLFL